MGATTISELEMERGIEDFEKQCWEKINITLRNNEAQEDQDDSVICDVCRSVSVKSLFKGLIYLALADPQEFFKQHLIKNEKQKSFGK